MIKLGTPAAELRSRAASKLAHVITAGKRELQVVTLCAFSLWVIVAAGCGKFFPSASTLVAITISPSNPTIQPSKTQQFTATGTFGDNSTKDISSTVTWSSSAANIATINSSGLATAGANLGSTTISAKSGNQTAGTTLTISNQSSGGLTIACTGCISQGSGTFTALRSSGSVTFTATDTNNNIVSPTWSSSNTAVATIGSSTGLATLVAAGQTTITATVSGASGSISLTVQ